MISLQSRNVKKPSITGISIIMRCLRCGSANAEKAGKIRDRQRYKCRRCGYLYTTDKPRGRAKKDKILAALLYLQGISMSEIAKLLNVSKQTISRWVKIMPSEAEEKAELLTIERLKDLPQTALLSAAADKPFYFIVQKLPSGRSIVIMIEKPSSD